MDFKNMVMMECSFFDPQVLQHASTWNHAVQPLQRYFKGIQVQLNASNKNRKKVMEKTSHRSIDVLDALFFSLHKFIIPSHIFVFHREISPRVSTWIPWPMGARLRSSTTRRATKHRCARCRPSCATAGGSSWKRPRGLHGFGRWIEGTGGQYYVHIISYHNIMSMYLHIYLSIHLI